MNDLTIVLTACIRPVAPVLRSDPELRMEDYRRGLKFWLELPDPRIRRIIFLENTAFPLDDLEREARAANPHRRALEFVSLDCNVLPPGLHYGYTEFLLLDRGLAASRLYAETPAFFKATGRYTFPAISRLLDCLPDDWIFAADSRCNRRFTPYPQEFTSCALLGGERAFFEKHVRHLYREMQPPPEFRKQFIEDLLFDRLIPLRDKPGVVLRWPVNCEASGIGANNDQFDTLQKKMLRVARAVGRRVAPDVWF